MAKKNTALQAKNVLPTVKHGGGSVMVYGTMAASGVAILRFIDGIMDQRMYLDILKDSYIPSIKKLELPGEPILLQDNDPKHNSNLVKHWMLYNIKSKLDHPPQSPDLNVIEHLWDYLKKKVKERRPTSKSTLKQVLTEEWNKIPPEFTRKLALSMPSRLSEVVKAKGGHTSY